MNSQPNFLLIGAQKCGTTWLFRQLLQHPECYMSPQKEGGYFFWTATRDAIHRKKFREEYEEAGQHYAVRGEATSIYFWTRTGSEWDVHPEGSEASVPARVKEELGSNVKILLCLRDPIERALSAFVHYLRTGELEFGRSIFDIGTHSGIVHMGFYARHLAHWLAHFDPGRFLILNFEDHIVARPRQTLAKLFKFLEIDDNFMPQNPARVILPGLQRTWRGEALMVTDEEDDEHAIADHRIVSNLQDIYRADVDALDRIIGSSFSSSWSTVRAL